MQAIGGVSSLFGAQMVPPALHFWDLESPKVSNFVYVLCRYKVKPPNNRQSWQNDNLIIIQRFLQFSGWILCLEGSSVQKIWSLFIRFLLFISIEIWRIYLNYLLEVSHWDQKSIVPKFGEFMIHTVFDNSANSFFTYLRSCAFITIAN